MRIVVIGATGNVGVALVRELSARPEVTAITGVARRLPQLELPKVTWEAADVLEADLEPLLVGAHAVVHLAWAIQPARDRSTTRTIDVDGSRRVFEAAGRAGVGALVHASSVGAYAPGPRDRRVDESWPVDGVPSSYYSVDKVAVERELDRIEAAFPAMRVARLRPGIVFQRGAAEEIRRLFLGPFVPNRLISPRWVPVVPDVRGVCFQAVHAADLAVAYRLVALDPEARGAFNVATEGPLDLRTIARRLRALPVPVPGRAARAVAALTWRARLHPTEPSWLDLGLQLPLMDTTRIRALGWTPRHTAEEALDDLLAGLHDGAGEPTPPLAAGQDAPGRAQEVATGLGARQGA